jgi:acyl-CoA thioesterase FadM
MIARSKGQADFRGRIVNIASVAGLQVLPQIGLYCMSKAAVIQMTKAQALEWGRYGINTNAICPGYIRTEINDAYWETDGGRKLMQMLPRRRLGKPEDLDGVLLLLVADESQFINARSSQPTTGCPCREGVFRGAARWGDMDAMAHLNNVMYFRLMEERASVVRAFWFPRAGRAPILAHASCDFVRAMTYPGVAIIRQIVTRVGRSSVEMSIAIEKQGEPGVTYATGRTVIVWYDYAAGKSAPGRKQCARRSLKISQIRKRRLHEEGLPLGRGGAGRRGEGRRTIAVGGFGLCGIPGR